MKIIQSAGGPLVGLPSKSANQWSGIAGRSFIGQGGGHENDYEATGDIVDGRTNPPCDIGRLRGASCEALLVSMPVPTCLIHADDIGALLAQVHFSDLVSPFDGLVPSTFVNAAYREHLEFAVDGGEFVFFDAAYPWDDVADDLIRFSLSGGSYVLSAAYHRPDETTMMTLLRIRPAQLTQ